MSVISTSELTLGYLHVAVGVGGRMAGLVLDAEVGRIGPHAAERDDAARRARGRSRSGRSRSCAGRDRRPACVRGRIGVGDVLGDDAHAAGLGAQPGGRDRDRFQEVHGSLASRLHVRRSARHRASAPADRGLDQAEAARVERGRRLVVHLVGGDLHHLVFEIDGVAGRPRPRSRRCRVELEPAAAGRRRRGAPGSVRSEASTPWPRPARIEVRAAPDRAAGTRACRHWRRSRPAARWRSWCQCIRVRSIGTGSGCRRSVMVGPRRGYRFARGSRSADFAGRMVNDAVKTAGNAPTCHSNCRLPRQIVCAGGRRWANAPIPLILC